MPSPHTRPRTHTRDLIDAALGLALTCATYALFRGLGHDHVLYGIPALVMLVLLALAALKPRQGRAYCFFLTGVLAAALILRVTVGNPL